MIQFARKLARVPSSFVLIGLVMFFLLAPGAQGQTITFTGDRGSGCIPMTLLVPGPHNFVLADIIPAGSFVVITGATSGGATPMAVTDSGANTYVIDSSVVFFATYRIYSISSVTTTALAIGDTISISYTGVSPLGETSCAVVSVFQNVTSAPGRVDQTAGNQSTGTGWSVTLGSTTTQANELLHVAFATTQATGGFLLTPPFLPLTPACSLTFCVFPGYQIVGAAGIYGASATTLLPVDWGGFLTTYRDATVPVRLQRFHLE